MFVLQAGLCIEEMEYTRSVWVLKWGRLAAYFWLCW